MIPEEMTSGSPMTNLNEVSQQVIGYIRSVLKKKYEKHPGKKAFHTKTIGLVKATITVNKNLRPELRVGLFKEERTYNAWIRFSNASPNITKDKKRGVRGMAIKVLEANDKGQSQDIILSTSAVFGTANGAQQLNAVKLALGTWFEKLVSGCILFFTGLTGAIRFLRTFIKTPNVLEEVYYSGTPYLFGDKKAIKWHVRPLKTITSSMPRKPADNFLRQRLIQDLKHPKEEISFALFVQFQTSNEKEPIDDATVKWRSPFYKVAIIILPKQEIDTDARHEEDLRMSFSPGNAIHEHAPLGSINMIRKKVYEQLAKDRLKEQQHTQPDRRNEATGVIQ